MSEASINEELKQVHPWFATWPVEELERVFRCPVCGSADREVLHDGVVDNVFFVAAGKWTLHCCKHCRSAYLDPRPSPASIGKAYGTYYTHAIDAVQDEVTQLGFFRRLRRMLSNGYLNQLYGTQRQPTSRLGHWLAKLLPGQFQTLDVNFRYLPKPCKGQRLLDVGCGNGSFLVSAREAGWMVSGIEPDPKAAAAARQCGLDVTVGTVDLLAEQSDCFDAITLSHVIEHVYEPLELLKIIHRLLKEDGILYIDTPNIQSHSAGLFKQNWRGLESPRHLVLFNLASLTKLLTSTGFTKIKIRRRTAVRQGMHLRSMRMAGGLPPYGRDHSARLGWFERFRMNLVFTKTNRLEFITLTARKGR